MKNIPIIYFIQCEQTKFIKIGITTDLSRRLEVLQTGNAEKLEVLAIISYPRERGLSKLCPLPDERIVRAYITRLERELHDKFFKFHVRGEWFKPEKELTDFISERKGWVPIA
jgi:hypothetical protein